MSAAGTGERRWVPVAELPSLLRLELEAADHELRRHPDSRRRYPFGILIPIGTAMLTFGLLGLMFIYRSPFALAARWMPLVFGAAVCGVWIGWRRTTDHRPARGQALQVKPASLVIVDAAAVEVLPAEHLTIDGGVIRYADEVVSREAGDELSAALAEAIARARTSEGRDSDPWRAAAAAGSGAHPVPSRRPLVAGGVIGAVVAMALELAVGSIREHPGQAHWDVLVRHSERLAGTLLVRLEDESHQRRLADLRAGTDAATTSFEVLPLLDDATTYEVEEAERARIVSRYAALAAAEVKGTRMLDQVVRLLRVALERDLDGGFRDDARRRIRELAMERAAVATYLSDLPLPLIDEAAELGLAPELVAELRVSAAAVVREGLLQASTLDEVDRGWFEAIERYRLGEELRTEARGRIGALARTALARARSAGEVIGVLEVARAGMVDDSDALLEAARRRFARFARRDLRGASRHDFRSYLTVAREYELGDELIAELYERWKDRALADISRARTSGVLEASVRTWYEPADDILRDMLRGPIEDRLSALAVAARTADDAEALIEVAATADSAQIGGLRSIRNGLAYEEAAAATGAAGIAAARRYLTLPDLGDTQSAEIATLLAQRCAAALAESPDEPFLVALGQALCAEPDPVLRWSTGPDLELARRGAKLLLAQVTNVADDLGVALQLRELNVRPGTGHLAITVEQRGDWHLAPDIAGHQQRPCGYRFTGLDAAAGQTFTLDGVCVRRHGDD